MGNEGSCSGCAKIDKCDALRNDLASQIEVGPASCVDLADFITEVEVHVVHDSQLLFKEAVDIATNVGGLKKLVYRRAGITALLQQLALSAPDYATNLDGRVLDNTCGIGELPRLKGQQVHLVLTVKNGPFVLSGAHDGCFLWDRGQSTKQIGSVFPIHRFRDKHCIRLSSSMSDSPSDAIVSCAAVDWAAKRLLTADTALMLWDLNTGAILRHMGGKHYVDDQAVAISCVALSSTAKSCISGNEEGVATLWDLDNGSKLVEIRVHSRNLLCLDVNWSSRCFASAGKDSKLQIVEFLQPESMNVVQEFTGHTSWVQCLVVDWSSKRALSGAADCSLRLWKLENGGDVQELQGHGSIVQCLAVSWESGSAVSADLDGQVLLWHLPEGSAAALMREIKIPVELGSPASLSVDWANQKAIFAGTNGALHLMSLDDAETAPVNESLNFRGHAQAVRFLAVDWSCELKVSSVPVHSQCVVDIGISNA